MTTSQGLNEKLLPVLQKLEPQRKRSVYILIGSIVSLLSGFSAMFFLLPETSPLPPSISKATVFSLLGMGFIGFLYWLYSYVQYLKNFKTEVIAKVMNAIEPTFVYSPKPGLPSSVFEEADMFNKFYNQFITTDRVSGKIGDVSFDSCELYVAENDRGDEDDGGSITTIFHGLFAVIPLNQSFDGKTYIIQKSRTKFVPFGGKEYQTANTEFNELFLVNSNHEEVVPTLITEDYAQTLVALAKQEIGPLRISLINDKLYCCAHVGYHQFSPSFFSSLVKDEKITQWSLRVQRYRKLIAGCLPEHLV